MSLKLIKRDNLFLLPDPEPEKTASGLLFLAAESVDRPNIGTVTHLGPGDFEFEVGDRVLYAKYAGREMMADDGQAVLLMSKDDVLCKVIDEER